MSWHTVKMTALEFREFRRDLSAIYRREIEAGRVSGYTLFARGGDTGNQLLFVSPAATVLFDRIPSWKGRLRPYVGVPHLKGFKAVPVQSAG